MMDRRLFRSNGHVAHSVLKGQATDVVFTDGTAKRVAGAVVNLLKAPDGALDRQLIHGDGFCVLEERDGYAFGFAEPSGYVGYVRVECLQELPDPTHHVITMGAHIYEGRSIKTVPLLTLPFGARLAVSDQSDGFWQTPFGYIPDQQIKPLGVVETDFAATALRFLGVPYLWGGDSNFGIDCSGLVHASLRAAQLDCPRDSDQQEGFFTAIPEGDLLQRGDLIFWAGHVGMMVDAEHIVHANGHHMATTLENLETVQNRILGATGLTIRKRARVNSVLGV